MDYIDLSLLALDALLVCVFVTIFRIAAWALLLRRRTLHLQHHTIEANRNLLIVDAKNALKVSYYGLAVNKKKEWIVLRIFRDHRKCIKHSKDLKELRVTEVFPISLQLCNLLFCDGEHHCLKLTFLFRRYLLKHPTIEVSMKLFHLVLSH